MVRAASGPESPVDAAFSDLFEVIPELEMYNSAQIVPGREPSPDTLLYKSNNLEEAKLYGSDTNLAKMKSEPTEALPHCNFTNHPLSASRHLPEWLSISMMVDQARSTVESDPLISHDLEMDYQEGLQWCYASPIREDKMLIQQTQHLIQQTATPTARDFLADINFSHRNTMMPPIMDNRTVPDPEPWFDLSSEGKINCTELVRDPCLSEYSSDIEQSEIKQEEDKPDCADACDKHERFWCEEPYSPIATPVRKAPEIKKEGKRGKTTFKSGRPRLCQFLLELLGNPREYSHLIEWVDRDSGVFKFLNSSKVAREWGERRNKPLMKYENFARSLRTYIAKGILDKPRSKLVYRFKNKC